MPIEIIPGAIKNAKQINECGFRAFKNDALDRALFPIADDDTEGREKLKEFRSQRVAKRLSKPGCHVFLAVDQEIENGERVLGYAVWYEEPIIQDQDNQKESEKMAMPDSANLELIKKVENMLVSIREDYLKELKGKIWYLTGLGVDPDFAGRGIASRLLRKGLDEAHKANLPAYVESTPAAIRVYASQGMKELGRKEVLEDGSYYFTAFLKMPTERLGRTLWNHYI